MEAQVCFEKLARGGTEARIAIEHLYDQNAKRFLAWLHRRGFRPDDSEDILQETFVRIFKLAGRDLQLDAPQAYLWRILTNCSYDYARTQMNAPTTTAESIDVALDTYVGEKGSVVEEHEFELCFAAALEAFRQTEPERATAIELAVIEGFSNKELATVLDRSYGATREFLSQCRKKFAVVLEARCGDFLGTQRPS